MAEAIANLAKTTPGRQNGPLAGVSVDLGPNGGKGAPPDEYEFWRSLERTLDILKDTRKRLDDTESELAELKEAFDGLQRAVQQFVASPPPRNDPQTGKPIIGAASPPPKYDDIEDLFTLMHGGK